MPLGISGSVTRPQDLTAEPVILDGTKVFTEFGLAGKWSGNKFIPLEAGDDIDDVAGILIRPYPTQSQSDMAYVGIKTGVTGDRLARGYVCVSVPQAQSIAAVKGAKVYVRVAAPTTASPLGSFVLTPDATATNTPELPLAKVMGPGDGIAGAGKGHIEIAYNI